MAECDCTAETRRCSRCGEIKPATKEYFHVRNDKPSGLTYHCKTCHKDARRSWRLKNKSLHEERSRAEKREYYARNKKKILEKKRQNRLSNPQKFAEARRQKYLNPFERVAVNISRRVNRVMRGTKAQKSWRDLVGYGSTELIRHLEIQFSRGMTWENYGKYWHVDHIVPVSSFDKTDPDWVRNCWTLSNLRPLPARENLAKSAKRVFLI